VLDVWIITWAKRARQDESSRRPHGADPENDVAAVDPCRDQDAAESLEIARGKVAKPALGIGEASREGRGSLFSILDEMILQDVQRMDLHNDVLEGIVESQKLLGLVGIARNSGDDAHFCAKILGRIAEGDSSQVPRLIQARNHPLPVTLDGMNIFPEMIPKRCRSIAKAIQSEEQAASSF